MVLIQYMHWGKLIRVFCCHRESDTLSKRAAWRGVEIIILIIRLLMRI